MVKCRVFIQYISQKFSAKYLQKIWVDERFHPLRSLGCLSSANAVYVTRFVGLLWPGHCNWCTHRGGGIEAQILFARIGFNVCIRDRLDRAVLFLGPGGCHFSIFLIEVIRICFLNFVRKFNNTGWFWVQLPFYWIYVFDVPFVLCCCNALIHFITFLFFRVFGMFCYACFYPFPFCLLVFIEQVTILLGNSWV